MNKIFTLTTLILFCISPFINYGQGNCNEADLQYIGANLEEVQSIAAGCGVDCLLAADPDQCIRDCIGSQTPLSDLCITCFVEQVDCVADNCFLACAFAPDSQGCADCVESNCLEPFQVCAGIVDVDGDTFTTLSDCDDGNAAINPGAQEIWYDGVDQNCDGADDFDQDGDGDRSVDFGGTDCDDTNPNTFNDAFTVFIDSDGDGFGDDDNTAFACSLEPGISDVGGDCNDSDEAVYPGAPGTGQNIDNNCNGTLDPDEIPVECTGDYNGDFVINSADLVFFLADFGCPEDCPTDINGDGQSNTADLTAFLAVFGNICQ